MSSLQHRVLTRVIPLLRGYSDVLDPDRVRREVLAAQARADQSPPRRVARGFDVERRTAAGLTVFDLRPRGRRPRRTVLYLHGGGYVSGLDPFHWRYAARLAGELGLHVVLPAYPLAPTHTWRDTLPGLEGLFDELADQSPDGVAVMGDSAGGGLAVALAQRLAAGSRAGPIPGASPSHVVTFAPWVELAGTTPGTAEAARDDPWLSPSRLKLYGSWWSGGDPSAPEASPLVGDLSGLPPLLVLCGTRDVLLPQSRALVAGAREAGTAATYVEEPGLIHVYPLLPIPEAGPAFEQVVAFLVGRRATGTTAS